MKSKLWFVCFAQQANSFEVGCKLWWRTSLDISYHDSGIRLHDVWDLGLSHPVLLSDLFAWASYKKLRQCSTIRFKNNENNHVFDWVFNVWCGGGLAKRFGQAQDDWYRFWLGYGADTIQVRHGRGTWARLVRYRYGMRAGWSTYHVANRLIAKNAKRALLLILGEVNLGCIHLSCILVYMYPPLPPSLDKLRTEQMARQWKVLGQN